jgi:hypothetical protein
MAGRADVELPMPAGADSISCLAFNPVVDTVACGSWDSKVLAHCGVTGCVAARGVLCLPPCALLL